MMGLVYQHPLTCAVVITVTGLLIAALALGWPFDVGETNDRRRA
jgi:hypothetical protein